MPNLREKTWTTTTPANVEDAQYWEDHMFNGTLTLVDGEGEILGTFNGTGNVEIEVGTGQGGDMAKSVYDTNDDGVVDSAETLDGLTASITELNYVDGVTSSIQDQLDSKIDDPLKGFPPVVLINDNLLCYDVSEQKWTMIEKDSIKSEILVELQTNFVGPIDSTYFQKEYSYGSQKLTLSDDAKARYGNIPNTAATSADAGKVPTVQSDGTVAFAMPPGGGASGHVIQNSSGTAMIQQPALQFANATVTNESGKTVVEFNSESGGDMKKEDYDTNNDGTVDSADTATTLTGLTASIIELNRVHGVTSNIQTQLNNKANLNSIYTIGQIDQMFSEVDNSLAGKVDVESGKGLSTNDYTDEDMIKLGGIEEGAEVNFIKNVNGYYFDVDSGTLILESSIVTKLGYIDVDEDLSTIFGEINEVLSEKADEETVNVALASKADADDLDEWSAERTLASDNTFTFSGLDNDYSYKLFCDNPKAYISDVTQTGTTLVYTMGGDGLLVGTTKGKLRIIK